MSQQEHNQLVRCSYCDWPGTFYYKWKEGSVIKVTDPMIVITSEQSKIKLYAHIHCHENVLAIV